MCTVILCLGVRAEKWLGTPVVDDGEELYLEVAKVYDDGSRLLRCQNK